MSEPTYRIETKHVPQNGAATRWEGRIYRLSEQHDYPRTCYDTYGSDEATVLETMHGWIERAAQTPEKGTVLYVDENGQAVPAPEPHVAHVEVGAQAGDMVTCTKCQGTGEYTIPGFKKNACPSCVGLGKVIAPEPQSLRA
jgi:hypothetical protein